MRKPYLAIIASNLMRVFPQMIPCQMKSDKFGKYISRNVLPKDPGGPN